MKLALKSISLAAVLLAITVPTSTVAAMTVGDFVRSAAELVGVTPATAEAMRAAGYEVPVTNLNAQLTEADVVMIGAAIGVPMRTGSPRASVSQRRAERLLAYLGSHSANATQATQRSSESSDPRRRPRSRSPRVPHNPHRPHPR